MRSILPETYINLILGYIQGEDFHRKHRLRAYIIVNLSTCEEALNKMDIQEMVCGGMDGSGSSRIGERWRTRLNAVINIWVP